MELVLSRRAAGAQLRRVVSPSGTKLGMVLFGVLALFFVGYLMWALMFPPLTPPEELPPIIRPKMHLAPSKPKPREEVEASPTSTPAAPPIKPQLPSQTLDMPAR
ncbi:MAG: hypothetical protein QM755_24225 [Luteolibacter sp.]